MLTPRGASTEYLKILEECGLQGDRKLALSLFFFLEQVIFNNMIEIKIENLDWQSFSTSECPCQAPKHK